MKKLLVLVLSALVAFTAFKGYSSTNESLFGREVGLSLGTGYVLDPSAAFQQDYSFNLSAGAFGYLNKWFGAEVNVPFYQTKGVSVSEVQAGLLFRLPLAVETPVLRNTALYLGAGGVYSWQDQSDWAYIGKVGAEFRLNKKWGFALEGQYRNDQFSNWGNGSVSLVGALHLVF